MNWLKRILLILFIEAIALPTLCTGAECDNFLSNHLELTGDTFEPEYGDRILYPSKLPFEVPLGARVYRLGSGFGGGGTAYRVIESSGQAFQYKYMTAQLNVSNDIEADSILSAEQDFERQKILYEVSQRPDYEGFRIAKPIRQNGRLIILENMFGQTVARMSAQNPATRVWLPKGGLIRRPVPFRISASVRALYQENLAKTAASLKKVFSTFDEKNWSITTHENKKIFFTLHRNNVLVEMDGTQTVFDPY